MPSAVAGPGHRADRPWRAKREGDFDRDPSGSTCQKDLTYLP